MPSSPQLICSTTVSPVNEAMYQSRKLIFLDASEFYHSCFKAAPTSVELSTIMQFFIPRITLEMWVVHQHLFGESTAEFCKLILFFFGSLHTASRKPSAQSRYMTNAATIPFDTACKYGACQYFHVMYLLLVFLIM